MHNLVFTIPPESCDFSTMDVGKPVVCISQHNQNPANTQLKRSSKILNNGIEDRTKKKKLDSHINTSLCTLSKQQINK